MTDEGRFANPQPSPAGGRGGRALAFLDHSRHAKTMNYRHAFHAGNFADVFKHIILTRILAYLMRKAAPLRFIDTHAGAGSYSLAGKEAQRSGEWRDGVARVLQPAPPPPIARLLAPYLTTLGPLTAGGIGGRYPGSPVIAQELLRAQDRLSLSELNPEDRVALTGAIGKDRRVTLVEQDGYSALKAWLPPPERRGLVLIDPAFEDANEAQLVENAMALAMTKWPTGCYALWRPIKERREEAHFLNAIAALGASDILQLELDIGAVARTQHSANPLSRTGLLIVNPPYPLIDEARVLLPWLAGILARDGRGSWRADWLTPPS
jgi:23S rRNA (adenine2030-N6)-methyltransferase